MLLHLVEKKVGAALRQGRTFHGYRAVCGAPIVAAIELTIGSKVAVGPEPHAQCARCFKEAEQASEEVKLPGDDPLAAPVYDEKGRRVMAKREREDGMSQAVNTHEINLGDNNGLGQYERKPFG
jgi:hypothetical protein